MTLRGNTPGVQARAPIPQPGAPCGFVDRLDFPLDPPDGASAYGGGDFGRFRSRYSLYHVGEDWSFRSSGSSLGKPVHSIGHGLVTYAQPLGWGLDQGVVIVRHAFSDSTTVLSFYGHLDPESVLLQVGDCVARGDMVGRIGKPRTSPHLHFEIRTHMPTEPGRGYSEQDPALAGWAAPSAFIWRQRIAASPGVLWARATLGDETRSIGLLDDQTYLVMQETDLVALDVRDGSVRWRHTPTLNPYSALIHPDDRTLYVTSVFGTLQALRVSPNLKAETSSVTRSPFEPVWEIELDDVVFPDLMPLPGGGVGLSTRRAGQGSALTGISPAGLVLWDQEADLWLSHWILAHKWLVLSGTRGDIWMVSREGPVVLETEAGGRLAAAGQNAAMSLDEDGVHVLDLEARTVQLLYSLPGGFPGYGEIVSTRPDGVRLPAVAAPKDVALSGGDILVTHRDAGGDSLTALHPDGTVRWRRSFERGLRQQRTLLTLNGRAYLVSQTYGPSFSELSVYEIDIENAELLRVFTGGSREPTATNTWFAPVGDGCLLIHIGGTGMLVLDTQAAHTAVQNQ